MASFASDIPDFNSFGYSPLVDQRERERRARESETLQRGQIQTGVIPVRGPDSTDAGRRQASAALPQAQPSSQPQQYTGRGDEGMSAQRTQAIMAPSAWSAEREAAAQEGRARQDADRAAYAAKNGPVKPIVTPAFPRRANPANQLTDAEKAGGSFVGPAPGRQPGTIEAQRADGTYSVARTAPTPGAPVIASTRFPSQAAADRTFGQVANRPQAKSAAEAFLAGRGGQPQAQGSGSPIVPPVAVPPMPQAISGMPAGMSGPMTTGGMQRGPLAPRAPRPEDVPPVGVTPISAFARPGNATASTIGTPAPAGMVRRADGSLAASSAVGTGNATGEFLKRVYKGSVFDTMANSQGGPTREAAAAMAPRAPSVDPAAQGVQGQITVLRSQAAAMPAGSPQRTAIEEQIRALEDQLSGMTMPQNIVPPARPVPNGMPT